MSVSINHAVLYPRVILPFSMFARLSCYCPVDPSESDGRDCMHLWDLRCENIFLLQEQDGASILDFWGEAAIKGSKSQIVCSLGRMKPSDLWTSSSLIFQWKNKWVLIWGGQGGNNAYMYTHTGEGWVIWEPQCIHVGESGYWKITALEFCWCK